MVYTIKMDSFALFHSSLPYVSCDVILVHGAEKENATLRLLMFDNCSFTIEESHAIVGLKTEKLLILSRRRGGKPLSR